MPAFSTVRPFGLRVGGISRKSKKQNFSLKTEYKKRHVPFSELKIIDEDKICLSWSVFVRDYITVSVGFPKIFLYFYLHSSREKLTFRMIRIFRK